MSIQEAWETLKKMTQCDKKKNAVFWSYLVGKPDEWVWHSTVYTEEWENRRRLKKKKEAFTKGELIQKVGEEEALRKIREKKYETVYDSSDDEVRYVKKSKQVEEEHTHTQRTSASRHTMGHDRGRTGIGFDN